MGVFHCVLSARPLERGNNLRLSVVCKAPIDDEEGHDGTVFVGFIMFRYVLYADYKTCTDTIFVFRA